MGKLSFVDEIKQYLSGIGWKMFIWGLGISQEEYWSRIYEQEKSYRERLDNDDNDD